MKDELSELGLSSEWGRLIQALQGFRNRDTNEDIELWVDEIETAVEEFKMLARNIITPKQLG